MSGVHEKETGANPNLGWLLKYCHLKKPLG